MESDILNSYFEGIIFSKVNVTEEFTIYAALVNHGSDKFVLAMVRNHLSLLREAKLSELQWECLQTRTLTKKYKLPSQSMPRIKGAPPLFEEVSRDESGVKYKNPGYPYEILLLNDNKKKGNYQYPKHYNLLAALLSFNCVITKPNPRLFEVIARPDI